MGSKILNFAVLAIIVVGIPFTVYIAQRQQEMRQRAAEPGIKTFNNCSTMQGATCVEGSSCDPNSFYNMPASPIYSCGDYYHTCCYPYHPGGDQTPTPVPTYSRQTCPVGTSIGSSKYYCNATCGAGDFDFSSSLSCSTSGQKCCFGTHAPTPTVTVTATPSPSPSLSPSPSPTPTTTVTVSPSPSVSPSVSPSISISPSPSVSVTPGGTSLVLDLKLQGIGLTGADNNDPKTKTRAVKIEIFNSNTTTQSLVGTINSNVNYDSGTGTFTGTIPIPDIQTGDYALKISSPKYLRKLVGRDTNRSIQRLINGRSNPIPQTILIVGDINNDNQLDIEDWNIWNVCHNKTMDTPIPLQGISGNCNITDLNDDGEVDSNRGAKINMEDYKWLFNSFEMQTGD
ncbi:MAG: hypothetical protein M1450_04845 [Patescibacteria group bacterium]|nr:hypothetical protein [Patescibacteria group bacterium]